MQNNDQYGHYEGVLLEEMRSQFKAVLETVGATQDKVKLIPKMADDIEIIKSDIRAIKAIMKDHSHQIDDHETRITTLETA